MFNVVYCVEEEHREMGVLMFLGCSNQRAKISGGLQRAGGVCWRTESTL